MVKPKQAGTDRRQLILRPRISIERRVEGTDRRECFDNPLSHYLAFNPEYISLHPSLAAYFKSTCSVHT